MGIYRNAYHHCENFLIRILIHDDKLLENFLRNFKNVCGSENKIRVSDAKLGPDGLRFQCQILKNKYVDLQNL